jgi:hypothetical protein
LHANEKTQCCERMSDTLHPSQDAGTAVLCDQPDHERRLARPRADRRMFYPHQFGP